MRAAWLPVLALSSMAAVAKDSDFAAIKVWQQPTYTLYSHDESTARVLASFLPRVERALQTLLPREPRRTGRALHIFLMRDSIWNRHLRTSRWLTGDFVPGRFADYLLVQLGTSQLPARNGLAHEYTHHYLRQHFGDRLPLWFEDGIADMMLNADIQEKATVFKEPRLLVAQHVIPMDRLLRIDRTSSEYRIDRNLEFHFQSQKILHRGLFQDPDMGRQIFAYVQDIQAGAAVDAALQKNFGMDSETFGRSMLSYSRAQVHLRNSVRYETSPEVALGPAQTMAEIDALVFVSRVMTEMGLGGDRLGELLPEAARIAPDAPATRLLELRVAARRRDDPRLDALSRELASAAEKDPAIARAVGVALLSRLYPVRAQDSLSGELRIGLGERAFTLLRGSEQVLPVDPEAAWALGLLSAMLERDMPFARERLQNASRSAPDNPDLRFALAQLAE
jgi:hypothetical protein